MFYTYRTDVRPVRVSNGQHRRAKDVLPVSPRPSICNFCTLVSRLSSLLVSVSKGTSVVKLRVGTGSLYIPVNER